LVSIIPEADAETDIEAISRRLSSVNRATSSALKKEERIIVRRILRALFERSGEETTQRISDRRSKKKAADDVRRGGALLSRPGIYKSQVGLKFKLVPIRSETIDNLQGQTMWVSLPNHYSWNCSHCYVRLFARYPFSGANLTLK